MTHTARRIGRTLALVLPVVLVLSGTLAVSTVPWAGQNAESSQLLTASTATTSEKAATDAKPAEPQDVLREKLLTTLDTKDPGVALTELQRAVEARPSLAEHCFGLARSLGRAAVDKYGPTRAQRFSRPVCDTSFATGVSQQAMGH
ncbi:hypothetical protein [Streptomyces sp. NPDC005805]|uniref:hypothetical protein n=1 Tax=Streptomyces sp. NPDC005805 TaxID=3157068 RepID=UPI0033D3F50B